MHRVFSRLVPFIACCLIMISCGDDENPVAPPPVDPSVVSTFTGTLSLNGAVTHNFTVTGIGSMTGRLTSLQPDLNNPVGFSLGTWNGSICQTVLSADTAVQGTLIVGVASAPGEFCVRIYDAAGTVLQPQTYLIEVEHN